MTGTAAGIVIREALAADIEAIAHLHVAVWRIAYNGLAPRAAFDALDVPARIARMRQHFGGADQFLLVAEYDRQLAGFTLVGAPADPLYAGRPQLKLLYVDTGRARRGIGRALLAAAAARLLERNETSLGLGVVAGNYPAIAFYEALGGRRIGDYQDPGPLWRSTNHLYVWDDLSSLAASA